VPAYGQQSEQVAYPFAAGPTATGYAAYTVDTSTANLWSISGSGSSWSPGTTGIKLAMGVQPAPTPSALAISPDGSTAYVTMQAGTTVYVSTVDFATRSAVPTRLADSSAVMNLTSIAVSADGQSLYAADAAAAAIRIIDAASLRIDQTLSWQSGVEAPWGIAAASDGTGIFTANLNSANIAIAQQINPT
jgi:DNA-binding beta-propeller fold protein YncE